MDSVVLYDPNVCRICLNGDKTCENIYNKTKHKKLAYNMMMSALFSLPTRLHHLVEIKPDSLAINVTLDYAPASTGKIKILVHFGLSLKTLSKMGFNEKNIDEVKEIFADTNLYLLCATVVISSFHVSEGDGFPSKLCRKCRIKLLAAYNLRLLAEKSYNILKIKIEKCKDISVEDGEIKDEKSFKDDIEEGENAEEKVEIKSEIDCEVLGDSIIKQEYLEVEFNISGRNKDEGVDDHLEDDRSLGYEDEDDTPLNLLNFDYENDKYDTEAEKQAEESTINTDDSNKRLPTNNEDDSESDMERKTYPCGQCSKVFATITGRKRHRDETHLGQRYYCELCNKTVRRKLNHMLACHTAKPYKCTMCNKKYPTEQKLTNHVLKHSKDYEALLRERKLKKKKRVVKRPMVPKIRRGICEVCGIYSANLIRHADVHDKDRRTFPCGECPKVFNTISGRRRHRIAIHLGHRFCCQLCGKRVRRLASHMQACHTEKIFACTLCTRKFPTERKLKTHILSHTAQEPVNCEQCGNTFKCKKDLYYHKKYVHVKDKKYQCHLCPKAFCVPYLLNQHLSAHKQERVYKCTQCDKSFCTALILNAHKKLHGDKRHQCQVCSNKFFSSGALKIHMISHTKEKKHPCRYCDVKFGRTDHRNRHEKTAHLNKLNSTQLHKKNITDSIPDEQS